MKKIEDTGNLSLSEAAQSYGSSGLFVVQLVPRGKKPVSAATSYINATTDNGVIRQWWDSNPEANVGIQPGKSGLIVLDVDIKNGGMDSLETLERQHGKLSTLTARTGSGGYHYYFTIPAELRNSSNRLSFRAGLDLICGQNHVVAPPSVHSGGGVYDWINDVDPSPAPHWLLSAVSPVNSGIANRSAAPLPPGVRGRLSDSTTSFMSNGAPAGTWNARLFKAAKDYQEQGYTSEEFVMDATKITGHLDNNDAATIQSAFRQEPKYSPRVDSGLNDLERDIVLKCHMIMDTKDPDELFFVDLKTGETFPWLNPKIIWKVMDKKEAAGYSKDRTILASVEYNPRLSDVLTVEGNRKIFNTYKPPVWRERNYYFKEPLPTVRQLPEFYETFITHLVDGHVDSKEYLLDWLSNSLTARNFTVLAGIGEEGIGKGVLGEIMKHLHGKENFSLATDNVFKERFNGKLENKTLVYVDEVALNDKQSHDRIKAVVNEDLEIEKKGKDSTTARNHASFYITSNNMDAIDIGGNDRRYSVIQLTSTKLTLKPDLMDSVRSGGHVAPENISALAAYLLTRTVTNNMMVPFRSSRFEEVRAASLTRWQEYLVEELLPAYAGKTIPLSFIQDELREHCRMSEPPGRRKLELLRQKYPEMFKILNDKKEKGKRFVVVN